MSTLFDSKGPMSHEEMAACDRVGEAVIELAKLSAKRMETTVESRISAFFQVANKGAWEFATLQKYKRDYSPE